VREGGEGHDAPCTDAQTTPLPLGCLGLKAWDKLQVEHVIMFRPLVVVNKQHKTTNNYQATVYSFNI